MERLTFEGDFCDIAQCTSTPGGSFCEDGACSQREIWERLKAYEDTHMMPSDVMSMRMDMAILTGLFNDIDVDRMREIVAAERDGRLVVLRMIDDAPAANVAPVVRCKDCKQKGWVQEPCHGKSVDYCKVWDCTLRNLETTFCSYGERKENNHEKV